MSSLRARPSVHVVVCHRQGRVLMLADGFKQHRLAIQGAPGVSSYRLSSLLLYAGGITQKEAGREDRPIVTSHAALSGSTNARVPCLEPSNLAKQQGHR